MVLLWFHLFQFLFVFLNNRLLLGFVLGGPHGGGSFVLLHGAWVIHHEVLFGFVLVHILVQVRFDVFRSVFKVAQVGVLTVCSDLWQELCFLWRTFLDALRVYEWREFLIFRCFHYWFGLWRGWDFVDQGANSIWCPSKFVHDITETTFCYLKGRI